MARRKGERPQSGRQQNCNKLPAIVMKAHVCYIRVGGGTKTARRDTTLVNEAPPMFARTRVATMISLGTKGPKNRTAPACMYRMSQCTHTHTCILKLPTLGTAPMDGDPCGPSLAEVQRAALHWGDCFARPKAGPHRQHQRASPRPGHDMHKRTTDVDEPRLMRLMSLRKRSKVAW